MSRIQIFQGEGYWLRFTILDKGTNEPPAGLVSATFTFAVKVRVGDTSMIVQYDDEDFDKTDIADGIVKVKLLATDTISMPKREHDGELKVDFGSGIVKKIRCYIKIEESIITS